MRQIVLDSSVVLKWYLIDEEHGSKAIYLLDKYISDELDIFAPSLLEYEVINGLIIAQKRGRIKEEKVVTAIEGLMELGIKLRNLLSLYQEILHYCRVYNCSAYDASYIALAKEEKINLITADKGLYSTVKNDMKWVKWLGDI